MDSATPFPIKREHFAFKPTFEGILSKVVKNRKLNYTHARKSLPVAPPKEFVLVLGKMNLHTKFEKSDENWERYRGHKPKSELN